MNYKNVVIQLLGSDPAGVTGKLIYNSTSPNVLKNITMVQVG